MKTSITACRVEVIGNCTLYLGDCLQIMPHIGKVDAVVTDPPYGINIDDFDSEIDISRFFSIAKAALHDARFFVFFGQMPTIIDWIVAARTAGLKWSDHIVWFKRVVTAIALPINRSHESIMAFKKGKAKHYQTKGPYSDVKVELLHTMPEYINGIKRHLNTLRGSNPDSINRISHVRNKPYNYFLNDETKRAPETVNFTNVWSFLPGNTRKNVGDRVEHATVKPVGLMERLCYVYCDKGGTVLDPFMGSGTTGVACVKTGRSFIGIEIDEGYFDIACERIRKAYAKPDLFVSQPPPAPVQGDLL